MMEVIMFEKFLLIAAAVAILVVVGHYLDRRKRTGYSEDMGEISVRIGYDVRDLYMEGYTREDINGILRGEYDLEALRRRGPAKKRK
jgi:hypothetical protein